MEEFLAGFHEERLGAAADLEAVGKPLESLGAGV